MITFQLFEPDINYSDEYVLNIYEDDLKVGTLTFQKYINGEFDMSIDDNDLVEYCDDNFDSIVYIEQILIGEKYRGNGFGTKLLKYFCDEILPTLNVDICVLYKSAFNVPDNDFYNNEVLPKFYNKFGFEEYDFTNYFINEI